MNSGQIEVIDTFWFSGMGRVIILRHGVEQNVSLLIEWDKPGEEKLEVLFYGTKDQWEAFVKTDAFTSRFTPVVNDLVHLKMGIGWV